MYLDRTVLANPMRPVGSLVLDGRVPPAVVVHDVRGPRQVEPDTTDLQRQQQHRRFAGLERLDHVCASLRTDLAVEEESRHAEVLEPGLHEGEALDELAEDQDGLALGHDDVDQLLERCKLARAPCERTRLMYILRRVVAD